MGKKRWLSLLLALALALSLALPATAAEPEAPLLPAVRTYAGQFTDLEESWCREEAAAVYETSLMDGTSQTRFDPQGALTYAQVTVITARLQDLLTGGDGQLAASAAGAPWYQPAADQLTASLADSDSEAATYTLSRLNALSYFADQPCDRGDFVWFLAAVVPEEALAPINNVPALPDTSDMDILRFYRAGILTGSDDYGTFNGLETLTRGQAAVILARLADPARRETFTLKSLSYVQEVLGQAPDTVMLTVDGYDVTAETYLFYLAQKIAVMELALSDSYYKEYPQYYEEYLKEETFDGDFADFLGQRYGIETDRSVSWNTPDQGGMTPAQKVLEDTLQDVKELAVLISRQQDYPLTARQQADVEDALSANGLIYGFSRDFARQQAAVLALMENLAAEYSLTSRELTDLLADEGYIYGQYVAIYRGDRSIYGSDEEALAAAESVRQKLVSHMNDPEYREFLIWKYSEDSNIIPDLLPASALSDDSFKALKELGVNRVSPVLTEDQCYMVVVKLDPTEDQELLTTVNSLAAQARLTQWAQEAQVSVSSAYEAVDVASAALALENLGLLAP